MRVLAILVLLAAASLAVAEEKAVGRYAFVPVEAGALRLDTLTGAVSLCRAVAETTFCTAVPGGAASADAEIGLAERLDALDARITRLEAGRQPAAALPSGEPMDQVTVLADQVMRRFVGLVRDLKRDAGSGKSSGG